MILLDSHVFYWLLRGDTEFGKQAKHRFKSVDLFLSSISVLELEVKFEKTGQPRVDFVSAATRSNIRHLPFTAEDAAYLTNISGLQGHDPFDRALLAQARKNKLDFYTADKKLLALGLPWVVDIGD